MSLLACFDSCIIFDELFVVEAKLYEEINLRPYLQVLLGRWKWIGGIGILTAVLTFLIAAFIPPTYEASALVVITAARQLVQFDPRFEAIGENQPLRAYPELAVSDTVLTLLQDQLPDKSESEKSLTNLRKMLVASAGDDLSVVRLSVEHQDADRASEIANLWANLFVKIANEIYGDQNETQVEFFKEQLTDADANLAIAEKALIEFEARNNLSTISNELNNLLQAQNDYLKKQRVITFIIKDTESLRSYLLASATAEITLTDQLTSLLLQTAAFNSTSTTTVQLQINSAEAFSQLTKQEQIALLEAQLEVFHDQQADIDISLQELEPQILDLQRQFQEIDTERSQLSRDKSLAEETVTALSRKVEEVQITSQDTSSGVQLASQAMVPEMPVAPRRVLLTIAAGVLGFCLAIVYSLLTHWWFSKVDLT